MLTIDQFVPGFKYHFIKNGIKHKLVVIFKGKKILVSMRIAPRSEPWNDIWCWTSLSPDSQEGWGE